MPDYAMLTDQLGLPHVRVTHYQLVGAERINLFIESTLPAGVCPTCADTFVERVVWREPGAGYTSRYE